MTTIPARGSPRIPPGSPAASVRGAHRAEPWTWRVGPLPWTLAAIAAVFFVDLNTDLGFAVGALYALPVLIASTVVRRDMVLWIASLCSVLVAVGILTSPKAGIPDLIVVTNRAIAMLVIWAPAFLGLRLASMRSTLAGEIRAERQAAADLHESMRAGLTRLLTLADQLARSDASPQDAAQRIRARAQVMLTTLGILARTRGEPVDLAMVLRSMLPGSSAGVLRMHGPDVTIPPRQLQALVLVFHELLSNSRAHGALATDEGAIDVRWTVEGLPDEPADRITLTWEESGGREILSPPTPGFGASVITSAVVHDLSGTVEFSYPRQGVRHQFQFIVDHQPDAPPAAPGAGRSTGR